MVDDHLIFLVTIPIHYGSNESSEISSGTTAISSGTGSGTHPHKILDKPSGKDEHGDIHTTGNKRKTYILRFKFDFCEKTTKNALRNGLNIDLGNILFVYLRDVMWNDPDKKSVKIDRNMRQNKSIGK